MLNIGYIRGKAAAKYCAIPSKKRLAVWFILISVGLLGWGTIWAFNRIPCNASICGREAFGLLGNFYGETSSGDLDGDGLEDWVLSAPRAGILDIYRGFRASKGHVEKRSTLAINGPKNVEFGRGWIAGDLDGDHHDDLLIQQPDYGLYVFRGKETFFSLKELKAEDADYIFAGSVCSAAVGDINGDGLTDVILGDLSKHCVKVLLGRAVWPKFLQLEENALDINIQGEMLSGLGRTVAAGDLNNDGIDDLVAFAWREDPQQKGKGYVWFGGPALPMGIDVGLNSANVVISNGPEAGLLGHSLAMGDVDGDGVDDLLFSAFAGSSLGREENGVGYIIKGSSDLPKTIDLDKSALVTTIHGRSDQQNLGYLCRVGDANGDGIGDCLLTGVDFNQSGSRDRGHAIILKGRSAWPKTIDLEAQPADWFMAGGLFNKCFGVGAYFADLDKDNNADLIIADSGGWLPVLGRKREAGCAYIFLNPVAGE